jgi:hypothetical protein
MPAKLTRRFERRPDGLMRYSSDLGLSAVDEEFGAGDEARVVGSQEDGGAGDVFGITNTPERNGGGQVVEHALLLRGVASKVRDALEQTFRVGDASRGPPGAVHRISRNASTVEPATLLAIYVAPKGVAAGGSDEADLTDKQTHKIAQREIAL